MHILIADDEPIERAALRDILSSEPDMKVAEVGNGAEVLTYLLEHPKVDLCMIDILMPEVDGVQVLQRIRRDPQLRQQRVVITSASRDRTLVVTLAQLGISGYLLKPYDGERVRTVVRQVAEQVRAAEQKPAEPEAGAGSTHKLLVVDANAEICKMIHDLTVLEAGWECFEAADGASAWALLEEGLHPALCICADELPGMSGLELLKHIRTHPRLGGMPVIVISEHHTAQGVRSFAEQAVSGYIVKPFTAEKIRGMLQYIGRGGVYGHMQMPPPSA